MPRTRRSLRTTGVVACVATAVLLSGCAGDPSPDPEPSPGTSTTGSPSAAGSTTATPAPEVPRPDGPAADISQRLTGGNGVFMGASTPEPLGPGYVLKEYAAKGRATAYEPVGALPADGRWTFEATDTARYRTRVVVRRPASAGDGIVLLEWLNVSGGLDTDPGYQNLRKEIVRQGHTWVGVSAQKIGVEGGKVAVAPTPPRGPGGHDVPGAADLLGKGLRAIDPERYGSLHHPGDRFAFDIVTQVARALRAGGPATGGEVPTEVLALGESQAAFGLTTYVNGVQPLTRAFDGFFVMSRAALGDGCALGRQGRPRGGDDPRAADDVPHRHRRTDLRPADRERRGRHPGVVRRAAAGHGPRSGSGRPPGPRTPTSTSSAIGPPTRSTAGRRSTTVRCTSSPRPRSGTSWTG